MDGSDIKPELRKLSLRASITVETTLVLSMILLSIGGILSQAYQLHDRVTGTMILQETVEKARHFQKGEYELSDYEEEGEARGNPRLWGDGYRLTIEEQGADIIGKAKSGNWSNSIQARKKQPEGFLRRSHGLMELAGIPREENREGGE